MAFSPWFGLTLTLRRWTLFSIGFGCVVTLLIPTTSNLTLLYGLRLLQGLASGLVIPLLLVVGLRVLAPPIRLFGLAAYALTATFGPNMSATLAALWTDIVAWQFVFFEALPLSAVAAVLVWYGVEQDPPQYQRFRMFDWQGALLIIVGLGAFTTMLQQGDRYDWFNSDTISVLALISIVTLPMLVINEIRHPLPLYGFFLLKRRNIAYGLITLFTFILLDLASSGVPNSFLGEVAGFRPLQIYEITLEIALLQLVMLPLMAIVLNIAWVDSRVVSFIGLCCILAACILDALITSVAIGSNFLIAQTLQGIGQPMVIMPLLMMATNAIRKREEAPLASAMVNSSRALAEPVGTWLIQLIQRWRGGLHYNRIVDQVGQERFATIQASGLIPGNPPPLLPNGQPTAPGSLEAFSRSVEVQAAVLTVSDIFMVVAGLTVFLMVVLLVLPTRTYPPRIALAQQ
jgi:MFS transporter, DHA2 family, multidrug resistance protein